MDNANMKQTLFDSMLTNRNLQILKAVLPYIDYDTGKSLGIYVKFQELKNSFSINPGSYMIKDKNGNYKAMNCDKPLDFSTLYPIIKDYLTTEEQEMFETFIGMMDMFSMDDEAKESIIALICLKKCFNLNLSAFIIHFIRICACNNAD